VETWLEEVLKRRNLGEEAENPACGRNATRLCISEDKMGLHTIFWQKNLLASDCFKAQKEMEGSIIRNYGEGCDWK
jgi:hypothetical protein